jgi:hypothetical protein
VFGEAIAQVSGARADHVQDAYQGIGRGQHAGTATAAIPARRVLGAIECQRPGTRRCSGRRSRCRPQGEPPSSWPPDTGHLPGAAALPGGNRREQRRLGAADTAVVVSIDASPWRT